MHTPHQRNRYRRDRSEKPDAIIQRLYEDNISGKISDERYAKMAASYETEQREAVYKAIKDDAGHRIRHIRIYYNFLGDVEIPDEWQDDEQNTGIQDENGQEETA